MSAIQHMCRAGNSAHGMMGLGVDGWSTGGFSNDINALLEFYGANATANATRTNLYECKFLLVF